MFDRLWTDTQRWDEEGGGRTLWTVNHHVPTPSPQGGLYGKRARDAAQTVYIAAREPHLGDPHWWGKQANKEVAGVASPGPAVAHWQQNREKGREEGRAHWPVGQATIPIHSTQHSLAGDGLDTSAETMTLHSPM